MYVYPTYRAALWPMFSANYGVESQNGNNFGAAAPSVPFGTNGNVSIPPMMTLPHSIFPFGAASPPAASQLQFRTFGATARTPSITVIRQPPGTAMPNRTLARITVRIDDVAPEDRPHLAVQAELVEQKRNVKSDALQGQTIATLEDDFTASFSRLKIGEVADAGDFSSAFVLQFQLFHQIPGRAAVPLSMPVRSNPFALVSVSSIHSSGGLQQSSSGPNLTTSRNFGSMVRSSSSATHLKRKRGDSDMDDDSVDYEDNREMPISYGGTAFVGQPRLKRVKSEPTMKAENPDSPSSDGELATRSSPSILQSSGGIPRDLQSAYVDITDLLSLPQKDAAARLGISESMLCKRFKECTRRKWPYRYLRKVEKQIAQLEEQRMATGYLTNEENSRLEGLLQERDDCLSPVRIRVTHHDVAAGSPVAARSLANFSTSPNTDYTYHGGRTVNSFGDDVPMEQDEDDMDVSVKAGEQDDDDDEWTSVAKTLEQLRAMGGSRGPQTPAVVQ
jgi:hypothetical protein